MFPNVSLAFTAGSHFISPWTVLMLLMTWIIGELRYQWTLFQGDCPSAARELRKAWRICTLYAIGLTDLVIFGWTVYAILLKQ